MYLQGQKLVEIASQLNLPEGTVRRWKCTHKWDSERSDKNNERSDKKKIKKRKSSEREVEQVIENPELTDKQRLFCIYYSRCFNATKAYQKAYKADYPTAAANGPRMLGNARVKEEILSLKKERLNREFLSEADIFQKYIDIAFSDITDYVKFGTEEAAVMAMYGPVQIEDPQTGEKKPLTETVNIIHFRDSSEVDGTIISEVKHGKNGSSIKLADRMKALQWLSDHMDLGTEEQKAKIAQIKAQTEIMRLKAQTDKDEEMEDDGFLEALKGTAAEDWKNEETDI
nr:MAG TPA: Terminase small subunit [Caudoviricetes sp.]